VALLGSIRLAQNATARFCGQKLGFARRKLVSSIAGAIFVALLGGKKKLCTLGA